ncbi:PLP-dependent aminotransferase family protein [Bailinhaonella thermotolerans]|uniref:PLP-dependent aminotransferase family protein n=1 Tax=Bailinhaonella thermotolerans TaxID=1070861 RepID=A0A3A4AY83_9ACTN|nr:PLP-dependent aminotransferase family protein [Bailinhaonella thermotolerans]RJL26558.1 PLP-dependent aminotransferase family protein [Bailinhaonella thermotolerans]
MNDDSSIDRVASMLRDLAASLRPGDRLPASRALTARYGVSPVTVSRAIARLAAEGTVVTRPGSGTFVAARPEPPAEPPDLSWQSVALGDRAVDDQVVSTLLTAPPEGVIPLTGGYLPPGLRPDQALSAAAARAVRRPDAWSTPPLGGLEELRRWFAALVGGDVTPGDVLVTAGGQAALTTALRALAPPGAPLLMETPTYPGALSAARAAGLRPTGVPLDGDGVRPDLLAEAFALTGARVLYTQPTLHNPTGVVQPLRRREEVLAVARAAGAFVIEDDWGRHFAEPAHSPPPLAALDRHGAVVHLSSLTKVTSSSLRVGALVARGPVARRLRSTSLVDSFFVARPLQETALDFATSPAWRRHVAAVRAELLSRRDQAAAELARHLPEVAFRLPPGGLHLWLRLPGHVDEAALADAALRHGVQYSPGRLYYPAEPPAPHLRLTPAAPATRAEITEGVHRLAKALASC